MVLKYIMDVLDRIEFGQPLEQALSMLNKGFSSTTGANPRSYVAHAVDSYLTATADRSLMLLERRWLATQHKSDIVRELCSWGRCYQSTDGSHRELRLLRLGHADKTRRTHGEVAVAAVVTAFGHPASNPERWSNAFERSEGQLPERVTVLEIGLLDGSRNILFDGTPDQAQDKYTTDGRDAVTALLNGSGIRPGRDCLKCQIKVACPAVPRAANLLGIQTPPRAPMRKVSISDLRYYERCPARYRLQAMLLPRLNEYDRYARLGKAVHKVLEQQHATAAEPCSLADMPTDDGWAAGLDLDEADVHAGLAMLANHPMVCPLHVGVAPMRIEPNYVFYDTSAQAMIIAKPDLVYQDAGAWVWREIKTSQRVADTRPVLEVYPQLALATTVLAAGLLGGDTHNARIELEVLRPDRSDLVQIDPHEPENLAQAREVLRKFAQPWRDDTVFQARSGKSCRTCPVRRWCPSAADPE
ncbi:PD-(D/E)XK nuclease family protein [Micromonospora chersina]|uniref:PD-(D/E)XK nuclease family protein n=1 Tax=Micromonospora chersina TaxID=47854 RepID=UPI00345361B1